MEWESSSKNKFRSEIKANRSKLLMVWNRWRGEKENGVSHGVLGSAGKRDRWRGESENGVGCGLWRRWDRRRGRPAKELREREKSEGFTVDRERESNGVKGKLSWSCAMHMTRTHVNFLVVPPTNSSNLGWN